MEHSIHRKVRRLDLDKALGRRLASLRKQTGKRQVEVGKELQVKRPLVSKIENGHRSLGAVEIVDYAQALGMEPEELFGQILDVVLEYDGKTPEEREQR